MDKLPPGRRVFLKKLTALGAAGVPLALSQSEVSAQHIHPVAQNSAAGRPAQAASQVRRYLTQAEFDFIEAAAARLIPADELGPGAKEAGAAWFIDGQLESSWGTMGNVADPRQLALRSFCAAACETSNCCDGKWKNAWRSMLSPALALSGPWTVIENFFRLASSSRKSARPGSLVAPCEPAMTTVFASERDTTSMKISLPANFSTSPETNVCSCPGMSGARRPLPYS